ncbi:hypothetical protein [Acinetobacter chinensis]|uniref:hypothetical protein n=1 Tax=Acinetobacter chinensis TaxID=2004650 RepID=UPI0029345510|nr:hypothetical protein [Acinetobacter chinensis]WOE42289.1 hypothetical protein QSG87_03880 [Acinetobacter chinensis]
MKNFELEIRNPQHYGAGEAAEKDVVQVEGVLNSFDTVSWKEKHVSQLQDVKGQMDFTVTDCETDYSLRLILDAESICEQPEFRLVSDIEIVIPQKLMLGLITRKTREYISFKHLSLTRARVLLKAFTEGDLEYIRNCYLYEPEHAIMHTSYDMQVHRT